MSSARPHWLLYALGGGLGHLTRALALARAASRRPTERGGADCTIVANTPWASALGPFVSEEAVRWIILSASADRAAIAAAIERLLTQSWNLLIVDTFPRGLGGELAPLLGRVRCPRVLVHRDLDPRYVEARRIRQFVAAHYDLVLSPGESGPLADLPRCHRTPPWLVRDAHELASRDDARAALGITTGEPIVLVSAGGRPEELDDMRALARGLAAEGRAVVFSSLADGGHFPLIERMAGVDVLVGGGGYHTVAEARATGTPLVGIAFPRRYDRQARRLAGFRTARDVVSARQAVAELLETPRVALPSYQNGVHDAFGVLDALTAG